MHFNRAEASQLCTVRLNELFHSRRPPALLGDPQHRLSGCNCIHTEVRLSRDGKGYTFCEYREFHGEEWATWYWERSKILHPCNHHFRRMPVRDAFMERSYRYLELGEYQQMECHRALLRILGKHNDFVKGKKVLTNSKIADVLPLHIQQLIATFITASMDIVNAMTYVKHKNRLKNKSMQNIRATRP